jgi:hypothetical protein
MIRIAITQAAFEAIAATMPWGLRIPLTAPGRRSPCHCWAWPAFALKEVTSDRFAN